MSLFCLFGFPGGSYGKASARNVGDSGLIPGSGRSPGERNANPPQYSCLENPMDREAWQATYGPWGRKGSDMTERLHFVSYRQDSSLHDLSLPKGSRQRQQLRVVSDSATQWTAAYQAPLSMGFSRQEYWSELPFPSPEDLPKPGVEPRSPALQADCFLLHCKRQEQFLIKGGTATKSPQAGFKDQRSSPRLGDEYFGSDLCLLRPSLAGRFFAADHQGSPASLLIMHKAVFLGSAFLKTVHHFLYNNFIFSNQTVSCKSERFPFPSIKFNSIPHAILTDNLHPGFLLFAENFLFLLALITYLN